MVTSKDKHSTWGPPVDFIQIKSQVDGVSVYAPKPKLTTTDHATNYACPNCGANVSFNVAAGGITCEYCGYSAPVEGTEVGKATKPFEFTLDTLQQDRQGWGIERQVYHCNSCGGELSLPEGSLTTTCLFCGSNQVNVVSIPQEVLRPRFLVPFKISPEKTKVIAKTWLGKGWFHPTTLADNPYSNQFFGVYLPFWLFNASINANWHAEVGYVKTERYYNIHTKKWETRTRTIWVPENGEVNFDTDDLTIPGTSNKHLSHKTLRKIYPFSMDDLIEYSPDYLAGWRANAYEVSLTDAWTIGKRNIRDKAKTSCYAAIPSNKVRNFKMDADFSDETWRYILLPVYLVSYQYEDKIYQMMINGQTGAIAGTKPVVWSKVWLAFAAAVAPGALFTIIGLIVSHFNDTGGCATMLGIILLLIGIITGFSFIRDAKKTTGE